MIQIKDIKTPVYVYDGRALEKNISDMLQIVQSYYPKFRIGYSYKTNYFPGFLRIAKEHGLYAEIVSQDEYWLAKDVGNIDSNIIYNGVIDDLANKLFVAHAGGIVNIENMAEMRKFIDYTNDNMVKLEVGIRVNFDVGNGLISRFGIDVDSKDFEWLANPSNHPYLTFKCVHFHLGGARAPEYFRARVRKTVEIARMLGARIVDIGGNIYGRMGDDFKAQLPFEAPSLEDVCTAIGQEMQSVCPDNDIELIAECGSPLVSDAMHLLTTITNVHSVRGQTFLTCDCRNTDAGWSISKYDPSREYFGIDKNTVHDAIVCGCECREKDILIRKYTGPADIGGKLMIRNVGSYSYSVVNNFISPGCHKCIPIESIIF